MITRSVLAQRLARRDLAAWSVVERAQDRAILDERTRCQRREHRTGFTVTVHCDVPRGRGSARLELGPVDDSADAVIDRAISLALAAVGPAWTSAPPAAPARVQLADETLVPRELVATATATLANLRRPAGVTVTARADVLLETTSVVASSGFHATWLATALRCDASLAAGPHHLRVTRQARRASDLELDAALASAADDLQLLADAAPASPGPCALWLGPEALLPASDDHPHGLWSVFVHQADAAIARRGLTRFRPRAELAPGAAQLAEPLSITSDGALDFALLSTPVTDDAVAVRRFPLVERGVAAGLGLSPREAALRRTDPNGGVRNLVVAPGTWSPGPTATRTLEVRRLHAVTLDHLTGDAALDLAVAFDHRPGTSPSPITGGTIHLDLFAALARARRSPRLLRRGAYLGPSDLLIDDATLLL